MDEIIRKKDKTEKPAFSLSELVIDNRELIYPFLFYIAGLILGSFFFTNINNSRLSELMETVFKLTESSFDSLFLNKFCVYFSLFTITVLLGLCLIGFPFINIIPFLSGIEIALRTSFYYVNYSAKGIGYAVLMIIPESAAFIAVLLYTIKTSTMLSKSIYNITTKKTDMTEDLDLKSYLKSFLIYGAIVVIISLVNALAAYLLESLITL